MDQEIKNMKTACFECESSSYETKLMEYLTTDGEGKEMNIPNVPREVCDTCGDVCFSSEASRSIESAREKSGVVYRNSKHDSSEL